METIPDAIPSVLTEPPIEEQLAWHTLWPESHKLYGHGNEIFSLCCDHQGKLVASSCKVRWNGINQRNGMTNSIPSYQKLNSNPFTGSIGFSSRNMAMGSW